MIHHLTQHPENAVFSGFCSSCECQKRLKSWRSTGSNLGIFIADIGDGVHTVDFKPTIFNGIAIIKFIAFTGNTRNRSSCIRFCSHTKRGGAQRRISEAAQAAGSSQILWPACCTARPAAREAFTKAVCAPLQAGRASGVRGLRPPRKGVRPTFGKFARMRRRFLKEPFSAFIKGRPARMCGRACRTMRFWKDSGNMERASVWESDLIKRFPQGGRHGRSAARCAAAAGWNAPFAPRPSRRQGAFAAAGLSLSLYKIFLAPAPVLGYDGSRHANRKDGRT